MTEMAFEPFPKIARLNRDITITEKIDGTNACVIITEDGQIGAASRTRLITPEDDNFGFARWVEEHAEALRSLGPGRHYGEWWGNGIQRRYGMVMKVFSLFNTHRWADSADLPYCCRVVPVLYEGPYTDKAITDALYWLRISGSKASRGFQDPEGIVVWHHAARCYFKITLEGDEAPKSFQ